MSTSTYRFDSDQPISLIFFSATNIDSTGKATRGPLVQIGAKWPLSDRTLGNSIEWHVNLRDIYNGTVLEVTNTPEAIARIKHELCPTQSAARAAEENSAKLDGYGY